MIILAIIISFIAGFILRDYMKCTCETPTSKDESVE